MVLKKGKQILYQDVLTLPDQPLIKSWKVMISIVDVRKSENLEDKRTDNLMFYNRYIKEKRAELMTLYPNASKGVIYEMAKQAYRDFKSTIKIENGNHKRYV